MGRLQIVHPPLLLGSPLLLILVDFPPYPLIMASPFIRDLRVETLTSPRGLWTSKRVETWNYDIGTDRRQD